MLKPPSNGLFYTVLKKYVLKFIERYLKTILR